MVLKKYHVRAEFKGNKEFHRVVSNSAIVRIDDPHHVLTMNTAKNSYDTDDNVIVVFTLKNQWGDNIQGSVNLTIINPHGLIREDTIVTNNKGEATYSLVCDVQGLWKFSATSVGTGKYLSGTANEIQLPVGKAYSKLELILKNNRELVEDNVVIQAKLMDEGGNLLHGKRIKFYKNDETTPFTISTTTRGIASATCNLTQTGITKFWARFEEDFMYKTSRTIVKSITVEPRPVKLAVLNTILFPSWQFEVGVDDNYGDAIPSATIHIKLWMNNETVFDGNVSVKDGVGATPPINFQERGYLFYEVKFSGTSKYGAKTIVDSTKGVYVKLSQGIKLLPKTISNIKTVAPYRGWNNLTQAQLYNEGKYARCGSETSPIEKKSLGFNTPASLSLEGLELSIPEGSRITLIDVRMWLRGVGFNKVLPSFDAPLTNLKVQNKFSLVAHGTDGVNLGKIVKINNNSFRSIHCVYENPNVGDTIIKSKDLAIDIIFPPNPEEIKGMIDMDYVDVLIEYIPKQVR